MQASFGMQDSFGLPQPQQEESSFFAARPRPQSETRRAPPSQDRPFACPVPECGGRFHRKFTLHEHMKTHTGEQPHQCPVANCGKRFSTSGNLARHRKLHSVHKLNCPTAHCSRVFTSREKLVRHLKVHLAGTPHTCEFPGCGKTFSTAGNLTRHRRTRHDAPPANRSSLLGPQRPPPPSGMVMPVGFQLPMGPSSTTMPGFQRQAPSSVAGLQGQPRQHVTQELHATTNHYPAPRPMLTKRSFWSTTTSMDPTTTVAATATATVAESRPDCRISDQDVKDLLDCLFVENPAVAARSNMGGMIRSEPFMHGAYHP